MCVAVKKHCPTCYDDVIASPDKWDWYRCDNCKIFFGYDNKKISKFYIDDFNIIHTMDYNGK